MYYLCNLLSFAELFLPGDGHLLDQLLGLFQSIFQLWSLQRLKKKKTADETTWVQNLSDTDFQYFNDVSPLPGSAVPVVSPLPLWAP